MREEIIYGSITAGALGVFGAEEEGDPRIIQAAMMPQPARKMGYPEDSVETEQ